MWPLRSLLTLVAVRHEPKDDRPELSDALWVQYVLDNFKTVKEAVQAHKEGRFRLVAATSPALDTQRPLAPTLPSRTRLEIRRSSNMLPAS